MCNSSVARENRFRTCVHEAAHAVVFALVGTTVIQLEVAAQGHAMVVAIDLGDERERFYASGVCKTVGGSSGTLFLKWNPRKRTMIPDRNGFKAFFKQSEIPAGWSLKRLIRQNMRGEVCGLLAGEIATHILEGGEEGDIHFNRRSPDYVKAVGLCKLLPYGFKRELNFLARQTEQMLRTPRIWERVLELANLLEQHGSLDNGGQMIPFLPDPLRNWPKPLRRQAAVPLQPKLKLAA